MDTQNYKNHSRFVPGYHYLAFALAFLLFVGSIVNLVKSSSENLYSASLIVVVTVLLIIIGYYTRVFALKAQDRTIRSEENFRHYLLTGKPMNPNLKMRQIIGLRFASDDEFVELVNKAVDENISEKDIKKSIKNWKSDNYRV